MITQENIKVTAYKSDGFIGKYQKLIRDTVIPYQYSVLCDEAPDTEKSHVVKNFENAAKALAEPARRSRTLLFGSYDGGRLRLL